MLKLGMFWTFYLGLSAIYFKPKPLGLFFWIASALLGVLFTAVNLRML